MIKSTSYSQKEIIQNIIELHLGGNPIECDPTYSKGVFYKDLPEPKLKFDIVPQTPDTLYGTSEDLPIGNGVLNSLMFDPPFVIGYGPSIENPKEGSNKTHRRFGSFKSVDEMFSMYENSLKEFYRVLVNKGKLIVKCQDTINSGKQILSHVFLINKAAELGFYCKDIFILLAKNRLMSGKWKNQLHARKFHSYFLVFEKRINNG